jgi:hypothetical protein
MTDERTRAWAEIETLVASLAATQEGKVLGLARRLKPGLTPEDMRNPHDFRELDDGDFHYEDGMLAGLHVVLAAVRARRAELPAGATPEVAPGASR